jgi:hypothetical protein
VSVQVMKRTLLSQLMQAASTSMYHICCARSYVYRTAKLWGLGAVSMLGCTCDGCALQVQWSVALAVRKMMTPLQGCSRLIPVSRVPRFVSPSLAL